jgi:hypothetical protein
MRRGRSSRSGATRPTEAEDRCRDRVLTRASASDPRRAARGRIGGKEEEARFRASGKHHRGVASAEAEMKGWCLPSSSGILALSHQQAPTRGDTTDATIPRPGCSRSQLEAGGAVRERQTPGAECDRDPWPGSHRGDPDDPRSQAALPRGGHPERLALRDPEPPCHGDGRGDGPAQPGPEQRRARCPRAGGEAPERPDRARGVQSVRPVLPAAGTCSHAPLARVSATGTRGHRMAAVRWSGAEPDGCRWTDTGTGTETGGRVTSRSSSRQAGSCMESSERRRRCSGTRSRVGSSPRSSTAL